MSTPSALEVFGLDARDKFLPVDVSSALLLADKADTASKISSEERY